MPRSVFFFFFPHSLRAVVYGQAAPVQHSAGSCLSSSSFLCGSDVNKQSLSRFSRFLSFFISLIPEIPSTVWLNLLLLLLSPICDKWRKEAVLIQHSAGSCLFLSFSSL
uniref:Putative secreted protein n=1 Tax=Panstrongylus lignarius TaxID=156445 RepID=A0A224XQ99_9HEMI